VIIPTLEKQALGEPYMGLAVRFTDVLKESRVLIVAGNSLRDGHIKAFIKQRLSGLHALLVSPSAELNRGILGQPDRTHALNAGFSEFLTLGGIALLRLGEASTAATNDTAVGVAVEEFIAAVSRDIGDYSAIGTNSELERLWKDSEADGVPTRAAAVKALAQHPHPAIVRKLNTLLKADGSPYVRIAAIDSLMRLVGQEATSSIGGALLDDSSPDVQIEAALALIHLGAFTSREWLERGLARQDIRPVLRDVISKALDTCRQG
jgi:hypothetical protein